MELRWLIYNDDDQVLQYKDENGLWQTVPTVTWERAKREGTL